MSELHPLPTDLRRLHLEGVRDRHTGRASMTAPRPRRRRRVAERLRSVADLLDD